MALQQLPVVFCIDRSGIVGEDGATHHGVFDIAYLRCIPNLMICAPMNEVELRNMMYTAQLKGKGPIAIRYPRGRGVLKHWQKPFKRIAIGSSRALKKGTSVAVLSVGHIGNSAQQALKIINDPRVGHYDMRFIKPLDQKRLKSIFKHYDHIITVEDACKIGGFGSAILEFANQVGYAGKILILGIEDHFVQHGSAEELHQIEQINQTTIQQKIQNLLDTMSTLN